MIFHRLGITIFRQSFKIKIVGKIQYRTKDNIYIHRPLKRIIEIKAI